MVISTLPPHARVNVLYSVCYSSRVVKSPSFTINTWSRLSTFIANPSTNSEAELKLSTIIISYNRDNATCLSPISIFLDFAVILFSELGTKKGIVSKMKIVVNSDEITQTEAPVLDSISKLFLLERNRKLHQ